MAGQGQRDRGLIRRAKVSTPGIVRVPYPLAMSLSRAGTSRGSASTAAARPEIEETQRLSALQLRVVQRAPWIPYKYRADAPARPR
jgi:hypothetical protein